VFECRQPLHERHFIEGFGWSIFPYFDVNVPMPSGTAVPPQVVIVRREPSAGAAATSTGSDSPSQEAGDSGSQVER
jgi:hypothetical protein